MVVLVTGMHRSGTSAVAELLSAGGLNVGSPDYLMPGSDENPRGFFERLDVVALNDELLAAVGSHWLSPPTEVSATRELADGPFGDRARSLIDSIGPDPATTVIKDPRLCLTLPFWLEVAGESVSHVVLVHRHPANVAASLSKRNGIDPALGEHLWAAYNLAALQSAAEVEMILVSYDELLKNPTAVCERLAELLSPFDATAALDAAVVVPQLQHESGSANESLHSPTTSELAEYLQGTQRVDAARRPNIVLDDSISLGLSAVAALDRNHRRDRASTNETLERERDEARDAHRISAVELYTAQRKLSDYEGSKAAGFARNLWAFKRKLRHVRNLALERAGRAPIDPELRAPDTAEPVTIPTSAAPLVSIVIPVHGELAYTSLCLASIVENTRDIGYEVIVIDDCSPDDTAAWLDRCEGVRVISNTENLGYLRTTNKGASVARGEFICLLNNDTEVHPGWLTEMVRTFSRHDNVGAVGARLLYRDGSMQEGGAIIFSDGTGWNYGRGHSSDSPDVNFTREVDYCSAACLVVRRSLWESLGGYDERYVPAYYEDTDLAFALRARGLRVLYQPYAIVTHFDGVSHGTDEGQGIKAHQVENRARFQAKWSEELTRQPASGTSPRQASWRGERGRVLILDHEVPAPDHDSGSLRMHAVMQLLVERGYRVSLFPRNRHRREPYASQLMSGGIEIVYGEESLTNFLEAVGDELSFVIVSRPDVAHETLATVKQLVPDVPVAYDMVDFHSLRLERRGNVTGDAVATTESESIAADERSYARTADVTIAITDEEAALMRELEATSEVLVLPNVHQAARSRASFEDRSGVVFVGSYRHRPNRDAIEWLVDEIFPAVWERDPTIALHIVGSDLPKHIVNLNHPRIEVHGWVPHLDPLFESVRISVAPLRYGAGLKGKVGDSMLRGVPVVGTKVAAEGFGAAGDAISPGESAVEIADAIVQLHSDPIRWKQQADLGAERVESLFGYEAAGRALDQIIDALTNTGISLA